MATFRITYRVTHAVSGRRLVEDVEADHARVAGDHVELIAYVCLFLTGRELVVRRLPAGTVVEPLCRQVRGQVRRRAPRRG